MSRKEKLIPRLKNMVAILMPLIFTSLEHIETISYALELLAFEKHSKRTFYSARPFIKRDAIALITIGSLMIVFLAIAFSNGTHFYNPFI